MFKRKEQAGVIAAWIACCKTKARQSGVSVSSQLFDLALLFAVKRSGPGYYFLARLWRPEISRKEQFDHLNENEYYREINRLNPPNYQKISQHKIVEKAVLKLQGLPTPPFLGFYHPERGSDPQSSPLRNAADLSRFLDGHIGERICFKTAEGFGGTSFSALDVVESAGTVKLRHPLRGDTFSVESLAARLDASRSGWILEEYLSQHPALAALNPDSVNTLRLIVLQTRSGFETRGALLRVGRSGSQVDNTSGGGLACPVDLASGRIKEALDLSPMRKSYPLHPDTGASLEGFTIPYWQDCIVMAGRALAAFPQTKFAGVDMALTAAGPSVIELNVYPDRRFAAHLDLPHARLFADSV